MGMDTVQDQRVFKLHQTLYTFVRVLQEAASRRPLHNWEFYLGVMTVLTDQQHDIQFPKVK
jgi:hypothetical protein